MSDAYLAAAAQAAPHPAQAAAEPTKGLRRNWFIASGSVCGGTGPSLATAGRASAAVASRRPSADTANFWVATQRFACGRADHPPTPQHMH
jgi:hypothetical protein